MSQLDEILQRYNALPAAEQAALVADTMKATGHMRFVPLPGPQTAAYLSKADVLLYGGQAGGGKTGLMVGTAQEHQQSIIFRREAGQTDGLEKFGKTVYGSDGFNGSDLEWSFPDGRSLKLAGMKEPDSWGKHAGRARDFMGFDEAGEFLVQQIASLLAWNRGEPGQRCRMILGSNPPRTADGAWMLEWFAPWLEHDHPMHAKPGELRWAYLDPDTCKPEWVDEGTTRIDEDTGDIDRPLSFTFIPAELKDNPYTDTPEYRAKLNALPEPLRSQLKKGIFALSGEDADWQMIPTAWIQAAMNRWTPQAPEGVPMNAIGADVAQGGADDSTLAPRYDGWFAPLVKVPGVQTPSGQEIAGLVITHRKHGATVILDAGGGWGADAIAHLSKNNGMGSKELVPYMGVKPSNRRSRDNLFHFTNVRTQALWQFREALDPMQDGGSPIALPKDMELLADLAAPTYEVISRGEEGQFIKAESKESVCKRLGRSPNKGDAVIMSWHAGERHIVRVRPPAGEHGGRGAQGQQADFGKRHASGRHRRQ